MSQYLEALNYLLDSEDPSRSYKAAPDACPADCTGPCAAIAGINSGAWPAEYAKIADQPQEKRGPLVALFYQSKFWTPLLIGGIESQDVANRVLDAVVNMGPSSAIRLLQEAVNLASVTQVKVDGLMGPSTLAAVNSINPEKLVAQFNDLRRKHYVEIADADPSKGQYLKGWLARAQK